jgi:hypothetical protein
MSSYFLNSHQQQQDIQEAESNEPPYRILQQRRYLLGAIPLLNRT